MKVVLIYRKFDPQLHSIEGIFHIMAIEMRKHTDHIVEYTVGSRWQVFIDGWRLRRLKADIYHITGDAEYITYLLPRKKVIVTVHDIIYATSVLRGVKRFVYTWLFLIMPIRLAAKVTSISKQTIGCMAKQLKISKVMLIPNSYNPIYQRVDKIFAVANPTILQIGTAAHKNVFRLIESLERIPCCLVLIGRLSKDIVLHLEKYKIIYKNLVNLTVEQVYQQYIDCDIVSFVSLAEGFGMPIIEAQAVGRAVITSNCLPMSDVAGDGALLVDPLDINAIRNGIYKLINNESYRNVLISKGLENIKKYSLPHVTRQYLNLYQQTLN